MDGTMNRVILVAFKATPDELKIADMCIKFLGEDASILNIPTHRTEDHLKPHTVVVAFGNLIHRQVVEYIDKHKLEDVRVYSLPLLKQLTRQPGNEGTRQTAFTTLQEVKDFLAVNMFHPDIKTIKKVDLPDLTPKQILQLEALMEQNNRLLCYQTTKSGKLISIGREQHVETKADIHMTFAEVYTIRAVMDVLDVGEVKIIEKVSEGDSHV